jgi:hypothetical protein
MAMTKAQRAIRYSERNYQFLVVGFPHDGKTDLAANWLSDGETGYFVPIDGQRSLNEYDERNPNVTWLNPELDIDKDEHHDFKAIDREVQKDAKNGDLKAVKLMVFDSITPIFKQFALTQDTGNKAKAMAMLFTAGTRANCDAMFLIHNSKVSDGQYGKATKQRESLSPLEIARAGSNIDVILEMVRENRTLEGKGSGWYGVKIAWFRGRPDWTGITLQDPAGNHFKGMRKRIKDALAQVEATTVEVKFTDFGINKPFPTPVAALTMATEYFIEHEGVKYFAFGDPNEPATKKDGSEGVNGAMNHAQNAYAAIKEGKKAEQGYPAPNPTPGKNAAGNMAATWVKYVVDKINNKINPLAEAEAILEGAQ